MENARDVSQRYAFGKLISKEMNTVWCLWGAELLNAELDRQKGNHYDRFSIYCIKVRNECLLTPRLDILSGLIVLPKYIMAIPASQTVTNYAATCIPNQNVPTAGKI